MDDLISREAAIDVFKRELTTGESNGKYVTTCCAIGYEGIKRILESIPSAHPEIIRCCECVHWNQDAAKQNKSFCDNYEYDIWTDWTAADWYCADAERREDGRS